MKCPRAECGSCVTFRLKQLKLSRKTHERAEDQPADMRTASHALGGTANAAPMQLWLDIFLYLNRTFSRLGLRRKRRGSDCRLFPTLAGRVISRAEVGPGFERIVVSMDARGHSATLINFRLSIWQIVDPDPQFDIRMTSTQSPYVIRGIITGREWSKIENPEISKGGCVWKSDLSLVAIPLPTPISDAKVSTGVFQKPQRR